MKRQWTPDELAEHWTLHPHDLDLLANKSGPTRLGFALLLKYFQQEGRCPPHDAAWPATRAGNAARDPCRIAPIPTLPRWTRPWERFA